MFRSVFPLQNRYFPLLHAKLCKSKRTAARCIFHRFFPDKRQFYIHIHVFRQLWHRDRQGCFLMRQQMWQLFCSICKNDCFVLCTSPCFDLITQLCLAGCLKKIKPVFHQEHTIGCIDLCDKNRTDRIFPFPKSRVRCTVWIEQPIDTEIAVVKAFPVIAPIQIALFSVLCHTVINGMIAPFPDTAP